MIESHTETTQPDEGAHLWRYMDFTKYASLLDTSKLVFSQAAIMEDTFEGGLPSENCRRIREAVARQGLPDDQCDALYRHQVDLMTWCRTTVYLSCWHQNEHQSAAMWKLYIASSEGVAIRTTFSRVRDALASTRDSILASTVKYIDYSKETFPLQTTFSPILHKRKSFQHEAEVRLLWWSLGNTDLTHGEIPQGAEFPTYCEPIRAVDVNLSELIQEVYVAPTAQSWFRDLVDSITRRYGAICPVIKSDLYSDPVY